MADYIDKYKLKDEGLQLEKTEPKKAIVYYNRSFMQLQEIFLTMRQILPASAADSKPPAWRWASSGPVGPVSSAMPAAFPPSGGRSSLYPANRLW